MVASVWGSATGPLALLGGAWSGDQIVTGLQEIWTGEHSQTYGAAAAKKFVGDNSIGTVFEFAYDFGPPPAWVRGVIMPRAVAKATNAPFSRGSTANISKGTTLPRNLREQLAVEEVISRPTAGRPIGRITMTDPRWPASDGWVKMQKMVHSGGREGSINVHYVYNTVTGQIDDLKIVLQVRGK